MLFPQNLVDGIDYLKTKIDKLATAIEQRDARIEDLGKKVSTLETTFDGLEQYSRRAKLRFQGLKETAGGEDVKGMIIDIINNNMGVSPPLQSTEIVRCHRVVRTPTEPGRPRAVLVKFQSERRRDAILRQRGNLKTTRANRVYVKEDLTAILAQLAYQARILRKEEKLSDTWTVNGKVVVKDQQIKIAVVTTKTDFEKWK